MPRPVTLFPRVLVAALVFCPVAGAAPGLVECRLGLDGCYKLGQWAPLSLRFEGDAGARVHVAAPDNDGVMVRYGGVAISASDRSVELYLRVGRKDSPIEVRVETDDGATNRVTLSPTSDAGPGSIRSGLASTSRLIVELNRAPRPLFAPTRELAKSERETHVARLESSDRLPDRWVGYQAVDLLLIRASDFASDADPLRVRALTDWVERGGRVVIFGGGGAGRALDAAGPLADLLPGVYRGELDVKGADLKPVERYADSEKPLAGRQRVQIAVTRLSDTRGRVEAFAGDDELPLVVRARRGLGEVVFAAIDPTAAPIAEWADKPLLLERVGRLERDASARPAESRGGALLTSGDRDLSALLLERLGAGFPGVATVSMLSIVAAAIAYLLLIGPVDYFVLKRGLRRMEATWLTFPAMVLLVGGGSCLLSGRLGGQAPRLNQLELVDVDVPSGVARGTLWAQAFSPSAGRHEVSLAAKWIDGSPAVDADGCLSWIGPPGRGLGGLQTPATAYSPVGAEYRQPAALTRIDGLPINVRSTKAVQARWRCRAAGSVAAELESPGAGRLLGVITNETDAELQDVFIAHGEWAWRVGRIPGGAVVPLDGARAPIKLKTLVRRDYLGVGGAGRGAADRSARPSSLDTLDGPGLLMLMMFGDAIGDVGYGRVKSHYQRDIDLSNALFDGMAVLVARVGARRSELLDRGRPWADASGAGRVYYRFFFEVADSE